MKRDRLAVAVSHLRKLRRSDPVAFAMLCSIVERIIKSEKGGRS